MLTTDEKVQSMLTPRCLESAYVVRGIRLPFVLAAVSVKSGKPPNKTYILRRGGHNKIKQSAFLRIYESLVCFPTQVRFLWK